MAKPTDGNPVDSQVFQVQRGEIFSPTRESVPKVLTSRPQREKERKKSLSKSRDHFKKAIRTICIARHAASCTTLKDCNGHYCNNPTCHKNGDEYELVEDHIDNNRNNNDPDNFQLLCRSCNQKKSPKHLRDSGPMGVREIKYAADMIDDDARQDAMLNNPQMSISQDYKEAYRFWLQKNWNRKGGVTVQQALYTAAKELDISPVTTRRYLGMETSEAGMFFKIKNTVRDNDGTLKRVTFIRMREEFIGGTVSTKQELDQLVASIPKVTPAKEPEQQKEQQQQPPQVIPPISAKLVTKPGDDRPVYIQ